MEMELSGVRNELRVFQQERDFFKQQYENLKTTIAQPDIGDDVVSLKLFVKCFYFSRFYY